MYSRLIKFPSINLAGVELVCIDIDNTLYHYDSCHKVAIDSCYEHAMNDERFPSEKLNEFYDLYAQSRATVTARLYAQGVCRSRLITFRNMFAGLSIGQSYAMALEYSDLYWETLINVMKPEIEALEFLQKAYAKGIEIIALTDMLLEIQIKKILKLGMAAYINHIISSEEAGVEKPESGIFELALQQAGKYAAKTILIGDSLTKDKLGAEKMGIRFYHVQIANE